MALNGVILYFPWGAGGNMVKNILSMDTMFEFIDDKPFTGEYPSMDSRYEFLKRYYSQSVNSETWLDREWTIRKTPHNKYFYMNGVGYWNPACKLIYDIHGTPEEIMSITLDQHLQCFDRAGIAEGRRQEEISPWTIQECDHVFLMADDIQHFTDIYASKNVDLDRTHPKFNQQLLAEATRQNAYYDTRLRHLMLHLKSRDRNLLCYSAESLFRDNGYMVVDEIRQQLNLTIPLNYIQDIHAIWLQSTRDLYYNLHNKLLEI
jgi:hypothetical protein